MDAMVDIETLGTWAGCVVLNIGYLPFEPREQNTFEELVDVGQTYFLDMDEQVNKGYIINPDTLKWWMKQGTNSQQRVFFPHVTNDMEYVFTMLKDKFEDVNDIWSYGYMDWAMLNYMSQKELGEELAFYRKHTDLRTLTKLMEFKWGEQPAGMVAHDPLHDCAYQAMAVQQLMGEE
jgi:hypothetical protein